MIDALIVVVLIAEAAFWWRKLDDRLDNTAWGRARKARARR